MAELLRRWLDQAGMRVDDLREELMPEHFVDRRVPGRTTLSDRLGGVGLQQDFVEAVADICSQDVASRDRLLAQVQAVREGLQAKDASGRSVGGSPAEAELVIVQRRAIAVSDKLLRAMERAALLERERNDANQMVLVLLAMVDKLRRDIDTLARQRDRLRVASSVQAELKQVHERLSRSEQQRETAEAELKRACAERQKADQLAEEAAEQVRLLTEELERLRGEVPISDLDSAAQLTSVTPDVRDAWSGAADDMDEALVKAARYLDDRADRLDQLAGELQQDNPPDNSSASVDTADNSLDNHLGPDGNVAATALVDVLSRVQSPVGADDQETQSLLRGVASALSVEDAVELATQLHDADLDHQAAQLVFYVASTTPSEDVPLLVAGLRTQKRGTALYHLLNQVAKHWPPSDIFELVSDLRAVGQGSEAYQLLSAVGRHCPPDQAVRVLLWADEQDRKWLLEAACRDRPLHELPALEEALSIEYQDAAVEQVGQARGRREEMAVRMVTVLSGPRPEPLLTDADEEKSSNSADSHDLYRPYAIAGGDARSPRYALPITAIIRTTASTSQLNGLIPEHQRICRLCREPQGVAEIAEQLSLPVGVARILVADLAASGHVELLSELFPT
ncbi:DUF742 domain-containing protein [Streptomyces sp. NPDC056909]|uniref:DUF742 domain-containing protein n=1 Tax=Streptomyces sp. NPDC056909 TaxID=3345963 RepID=UPI00369BB64F